MNPFKRRAQPPQPVVRPTLDSPGQIEYWRNRAWEAEDTVRSLTSQLTVAQQRAAAEVVSARSYRAEAEAALGRAHAAERTLTDLRAEPLSAKQLKFDRACTVCKDLMPWGTQHVCRGMAATARGAQS